MSSLHNQNHTKNTLLTFDPHFSLEPPTPLTADSMKLKDSSKFMKYMNENNAKRELNWCLPLANIYIFISFTQTMPSILIFK